MKIVITKDAIMTGLQMVQGVVNVRPTLPVLSNVLLQAQDDRLWLTTTDLEVTMRCAVEAKVGKAGATTISGQTVSEHHSRTACRCHRNRYRRQAFVVHYLCGLVFQDSGIGRKTIFRPCRSTKVGMCLRWSSASSRKCSRRLPTRPPLTKRATF